MRDFTLEDFDRHFGADIDGMGAVSLDDPYIAGDDAIVPCAILSGGSLTYRRGAVYTASALIQTGESFGYVRKRFFFCPDEWGSGQALKFTFRGWAWSPENCASGVWTEDESPDGVWVRTGTFSQQIGGGH